MSHPISVLFCNVQAFHACAITLQPREQGHAVPAAERNSAAVSSAGLNSVTCWLPFYDDFYGFTSSKHIYFYFIVFQLYLVGGSFGLREFAQIRYDVDPTLKEKLKGNNVTLESEYKKLEKSDLDNWENIRGPRLWEDSKTVQKQQREAARLKTQ
uniref:Cytochrome c oxidase assembly protein COX16 homolog, mitochondrial n=1 Tax=Nothoprocta perdicaria TaxID=30464 RepID=A0A8C6ZUR9_NOTPE